MKMNVYTTDAKREIYTKALSDAGYDFRVKSDGFITTIVVEVEASRTGTAVGTILPLLRSRRLHPEQPAANL